MNKFGNIEILASNCNLSTIKDGRGGIFTWTTDEPIFEFNMVYFSPGKVRGNHFHPEFNEYFLIVEGSVVMVTKDPKTNEDITMLASKGNCFRTPIGVPHAVHALTDATCISLLTKPWSKCTHPIIHEDLIPMDEEYIKYAKEKGFKYSAEEIKKNKQL